MKNTNPKKNKGRFFLIVPLGLEDAAKQELQQWCAVLATEFSAEAYLEQVEIVKGGIEFEIGESVGLLLNRCLKIPSRLLQRIHSFRTREWAEAEKELRTVNWKHFFPLGISDWEIAASESKINNEKHLAQFLEEKFERRKLYFKSANGAVAYLRVHDNQFTLSRDTSGEHLHFRAYRKQQGEAPLRENFAAFLWSMLIRDQSRLQAEQALIVDPFAGSGTLLAEAYLWNRIVRGRRFAYEPWLDAAIIDRFGKVTERLQHWNLTLVGVDHDPEVVSKAQSNMNELGANQSINFVVDDSTTTGKPSWMSEVKPKSEGPARGLEQARPEGQPRSDEAKSLDRPVWLISNPPYGGRGRIKGVDSWQSLWESALRKYNPDLALGLGPERDCRKGDKLADWHCVEVQRFLNGGLRVVASLWKRQTKNK